MEFLISASQTLNSYLLTDLLDIEDGFKKILMVTVNLKHAYPKKKVWNIKHYEFIFSVVN